MKKTKRRMILVMLTAAFLLGGCGQTGTGKQSESDAGSVTAEAVSEGKEMTVADTEIGLEQLYSRGSISSPAVIEEIEKEELLSDRDRIQSPDLSGAEYLTVSDGEEIVINREGIYVLSGSAEDAAVSVEADDDSKVQLVLDGLSITNTDKPCIYVRNADKVIITAMSEDNRLCVNGSFSADGDTNTDAVIFSKDDLVFNGTGTLYISSTDNGISGKDGIRVTGGELTIDCEGSAIEAHDEIITENGIINITRCYDGLHAEDDDDDTIGAVYIFGGAISVTAEDDGIHATTVVRIDDGEIEILAAEGIEGTQIQINGGSTVITAADDGINAAQKSTSLSPVFEMNGGEVSITMGAGDTDGVDANGEIRINGGTISINGQSAFDYDLTAEYNGGTVIVNGEVTDTITNQMMGGPGGMGGHGNRTDAASPGGPVRPDDTEGMERIGSPNGMNAPAGPEGAWHPDGMNAPEGRGGMNEDSGRGFREGVETKEE